MSLDLNYKPNVFVETANLTEDEWLAWRRKGVGGSDVAAALGLSPYRTARELYYDKIGVVPAVEGEDKSITFEIGHLLEDVVAKIFAKKTGLSVFQDQKMFQHPLFPFMLADVDRFIHLPNGDIGILECKTAHYDTKYLWANGAVPRHYELQVKHYMAVMNIDVAYRTTPAVRSGRIVAELLERGCELEGVPGFYRDRETGSWKLDIRASGIMIPDRNMLGEIEAIQIRLDRPYKSKFNNLTSVDKYYGTTASCCPHFAGTHDSDAVYLTEGVMKADIAQYLSNALGQPRCFIGLTGVGNINQFRRLLKELATVHINRIIVAFDMDALINENVRNARQRVLQEGSDAGFEMTPIAWDEKYKGIDDLLLSFKEARAS